MTQRVCVAVLCSGPPLNQGKMTDIEKVYLREAMARFKHAKFLDQEFRNCEMDLFFKKFPHWPLDKVPSAQTSVCVCECHHIVGMSSCL